MTIGKRYLGDGVSCETDGDRLVLTTDDGTIITNTIVLEPAVYDALTAYVKALERELREHPASHPPYTAEKKLTVTDVLPLVEALYSRPGGGVGCCLHNVLDDHNVSNADVALCVERAREQQHRDCEELALTLQQMTRTQRLRLAHRYRLNSR